MRIAQIAPFGESVPPKKYGGTERVVYTLTEHLVQMGHKVTLFASGDSRTSARLISVYEKSLRDGGIEDPYGATFLSMLNIAEAYRRQDEFDIIHDHNAHLSLPTALLSQTPVIMTMHGAATAESKRLFDGVSNTNNPLFVSISKSQRKPIPNLNWVANIYNGLDMADFPFAKNDDGFLLYVGRISAEKGIHHAITAAEYLGLPLIIAAKLDPESKPYFESYVKPHLNERIRWIGEVDAEERNRLMSRALCFLHPVMWREPFGLTLIEAGACGCPVVAFNKGSIPEIIKHGKNGFIAEDVVEMIEYVKNISSIRRAICRKIALENFSGEKMAMEYEKIYKKVLSESTAEAIKNEKRLIPAFVKN